MRERTIKFKTRTGETAVEIKKSIDPFRYTIIGMCERLRHLRDAIGKPPSQGLMITGTLTFAVQKDDKGLGYFVYIKTGGWIDEIR